MMLESSLYEIFSDMKPTKPFISKVPIIKTAHLVSPKLHAH